LEFAKLSSPYKKLGDLDPFGVSHRFNIPFALSEAWKKLMCGGIDGRLKSAAQDYKEAVFSIERGIKDISIYYLHKTASIESIHTIMTLYNEVFPDANQNAVESAKEILFFVRLGNIQHLQNALNFAQKAVEDES